MPICIQADDPAFGRGVTPGSSEEPHPQAGTQAY
jgi:hypothetical protein